MWQVGIMQIPTSAVIFLFVVTAMLLILLLMLLCLNKVCCFANCEIPSIIFVDDSSKLLADSESDDSDEEIFTNYTKIEKSVFPAGSRKPSNVDTSEKDDPFLETWEKNTLNDSKKTSVSGKSESLGKKSLPNKTSVVRIHVSLDSLSSKLKIQIIQVFDLGKVTGTIENQQKISVSDIPQALVYQVHCSVLPEKKHRFKTKLKPGPDPLFNETFYVHKVTIDEASSMSLRLRVYASQRSSNLIVIGQSIVEMDSIDLTIDSEYNLTMTEPGENESVNSDDLSITGSELLSIKSTKIEGYDEDPELQVGLSHNSNTGRLTVEIIRGINLTKEKNKAFYIKLSLFSSSGSELSHTKTSVRKNTVAPVFRESFMFQVALFQLNEVTLMITVFAKKSVHRKDIIGWIALGYKSSGEEQIHHWNEIKQGNSNQVIRSHRLLRDVNSKKLME